MSRPAWMTPIQYNDDRFGEPDPGDDRGLGRPPAEYDPLHASRPDEEFGADDAPDAEGDGFESRDTEPVDYSLGPHDEEFGVDEGEFESHDREPIDYGSGPHDDEFGVDDEDEAE